MSDSCPDHLASGRWLLPVRVICSGERRGSAKAMIHRSQLLLVLEDDGWGIQGGQVEVRLLLLVTFAWKTKSMGWSAMASLRVAFATHRAWRQALQSTQP